MELESQVHVHVPLSSEAVLQLISNACCVPIESILWVTQWGSRLFSLSNAQSDYDLVCAFAGYLGPLSKDTRLSPRERHYANVVTTHYEDRDVDIACYEVNYFQYLLDQHVIAHIGMFYSDQIYHEAHRFRFRLQLPFLKTAVLCDVSKNLKLAKKFHRNKEFRRTKKRLVYILQHVEFSIQLATRYCIYDLSIGLPFHTELFSLPEAPTWEFLHQWFHERFLSQQRRLQALINDYRLYGSDDGRRLACLNYLEDRERQQKNHYPPVTEIEKNSDATLNFMYRTSGVDPILLMQRDNISLYQLLSDEYTDFNCQLTAEGCGTVIEERRDSDSVSYRAVAYPSPKMAAFDAINITTPVVWIPDPNSKTNLASEEEKKPQKLRWDKERKRVTRKWDGILVTLFFYEGVWMHSFGNSIHDGRNNKFELENLLSELSRQKSGAKLSLLELLSTEGNEKLRRCALMFELVSQHANKLVLNEKDGLYFLGARDMATMQELDYDAFVEQNTFLQPYILDAIEELRNSNEKQACDYLFAHHSPFDVGGFVFSSLRPGFEKLVIRHPVQLLIRKYKEGIGFIALQLPQLIEDLSLISIYFLARALTIGDESVELESLMLRKLVPDVRFHEYYATIRTIVKEYCKEQDELYVTLHREDQRDFAKTVNSMPTLHASIKKIFFLMKKDVEKLRAKANDPTIMPVALSVMVTPDVILSSSFLAFISTEIVAKRGVEQLFHISSTFEHS